MHEQFGKLLSLKKEQLDFRVAMTGVNYASN